jgi:hypothetical protein
MNIGRPFLRRCTRLPLVAAPAAIALAAAIVLHIFPVREPAEIIGGYTADGTNFFPTSSRHVVRQYELTLKYGVAATAWPLTFLREPDTGAVVAVSTFSQRIRGTLNDRSTEGRIFTLEGDTLASFADCQMVCPTGRWSEGEPEYLVWQPECEYLPANGRLRDDPSSLFLHNYEGAIRYLEHVRNPLRPAYLSAARGDSLSVRNEFITLASDETRRGTAIRIPYGWEMETPVPIHTSHGNMALMRTAGGYQNVDRLYRLLGQPRLAPGSSSAQFGTDAIFGSFRGIVALDPDADKVQWVRPTGVTMTALAMADVNEDGLDEFIVSSYSPENGVSYDGLTDAGTAYVICLDWFGNVLWRHPIHGQYVGVQAAVADVQGGRAPEIVAVASSSSRAATGCAVVLAGDGTVIAERDDLGGLLGLVVADLDGDGKAETITGAPDGRLLALDGALEIVSSFSDTAHTRCKGRRVIPCAANDIDGDGDIEIVAASVGWTDPQWVAFGNVTVWDPVSYLLAFGPELQEETRGRIPPVGTDRRPIQHKPAAVGVFSVVADLDGDGHDEIGILCNGLFVFEVRDLETN